MRILGLWLCLFAAVSSALAQPASPTEGTPVVTVHVEATDGTTVPASVLDLIDTRAGAPLRAVEIRTTMAHLVGLNRYDDVRVVAEDVPGGVRLIWRVRPVPLVTRVVLEGAGALERDVRRQVVADRFGGQWTADRVPDLVSSVEGYYRARGFRRAAAIARLESGRTPGTSTVRVTVSPGARLQVGALRLTGAPTDPQQRIFDRLGLSPGGAYDPQDVAARMLAYEASLRRQGFYEAIARDDTVTRENDDRAIVEIAVDAGRRVRVVYAGDSLSGAPLDTLVPIDAQRAIDEDLLEDAGRNIERYLRERGFREAQAPYRRTESGGDLVLTFTVSRGLLHRVRRAEVTGMQAVAAEEVQALVRLPEGSPFADARAGTVGAAIVELYRVRGFEQVRLETTVEVLPETGTGDERHRPVDVRYVVTEGPRVTVSDVHLSGTPTLRTAEVEPQLSLQRGRPFYRPLVAADRDLIEREYRRRGFLAVQVTPSVTVSADGGEVQVRWTVEEGEQALIDRVLITGNVRTDARVIARELAVVPGQPLTPEALADSQGRVSQLGLFRRVRISDVPRTGSPVRDVLVTVEEAPPTTLTYGGGIEAGQRPRQAADGSGAVERIEVAPRTFFDLTRRNFWGKNRTASLFGRVSLRPVDPEVDGTSAPAVGGYGLNDYRLAATFREPRAFGRAGDALVTAFLEQGIRASFTFNRRGVRVDYARRFAERLTATARYTADYTRLSNQQIAPEDRLLIDRLFPQVRLSTVFTGLLRDSRDDLLDPTRGLLLGVDGSVAARAIGSEVGFAKAFTQAFVYRRVPGTRMVLAGGVRVGVARGFPREVPRVDDSGAPVLDGSGRPVSDVVENVPASERFFAGGDTTVRGFALDRLGTTDTIDQQGFPQGGAGLLVLNAEVRAPYWKGLGLVAFVDAGNVYRRASDLDAGDLRTAAGVGVRYRSPIGPIRIDVGIKLQPQLMLAGTRERRAVLHISLGQAF
jgi:outer membrane protein assembly complex protein YaeT